MQFRDRDSYTRAELVEIAEQCGICWDDEDGADLDPHFESWRQGVVAGRSIVLYVSHSGEVVFLVDGFTANNAQISLRDGADILTWFLAAWNDLIVDLHPLKTYFCYPEAGDGRFYNRVKRYKSIGFEQVSVDRMELNQNVLAASQYLNNWVEARKVPQK